MTTRYTLESDLRSAIHERHEAGISGALAKWDECERLREVAEANMAIAQALRADLAKAKERIATLETVIRERDARIVGMRKAMNDRGDW